MRGILVCLTGVALFAQGDWVGSWKGANIELTVQPAGVGAYKGTLVFEGKSFPITAKASDDKLNGTFAVDGANFAFSVERGGDGHVTLISDGTRYVLAPATRNPLSGGSTAAAPPPPTGLAGDWQGPQGVVRFDNNGGVFFGGQNYRYTLNGATLTLIAADGQVPLAFQMNGNVMTLGSGGQAIRLTRMAAGAAARGGVLPELVGKWCYQANVYATNGGARSSSQCFTLNADGTYQYYGETDSYNPNGGATSNSSDAGTWTATETTITANSRFKPPVTYRLEKRNHPKNVNDPMLVLDGQAFVSFYQKQPWR
jgi:hypothetical protein